MNKLFLFDAYAMVYRSYYAFIKNPRINSKGLNTSAIFGFMNIMNDVIETEKPSHMAVVFDPSGKTFRHEAYEAYKAQRPKTPEDIQLSIPWIKKMIAAYNIPIIQVDGYEADDVIGTLAYKADEAGFEVYMLTPDKDYGQLVGGNRKVYRPKHGGGYDVMGEAEFCSKYSLKNALQIIDFLALMGDASDNIPGCPGVGEKTAVKLLADFDSVENLLECTDKLKGALRQKVEENVEQIRFSKFLATIKTDVPVDFEPEKMMIKDPNGAALVELFTELEFRNQLQKLLEKKTVLTLENQPSLFGENMEHNTIATPLFQTAKTVKHIYHMVETEGDLEYLVSQLFQSQQFAFDTETDSLNVIDAKLVGMSFCLQPHEAFYIPVDEANAKNIIEKIRPVFEDENKRKIGQNLKFDMLVLENYGLKTRGELFDTMIAHYLLNPELRHGMDYMAEVLLQYKTIAIEELIGLKGKKQLSMRDVEKSKICEYAAEDADVTMQLFEVLEKKIEEEKLQKLFYEIEMPLVRVLVKMERNGVLIDDFSLTQSSQMLTVEMQKIEREIKNLVSDNTINISSPKQIGELLFDKLKIVEKPKKTKTGQYVTDEETLEELRDKHEVVAKILDYRGLKKLLSTYIDALPQLINTKTGKVHTSFNQTVTATGRLSSSNPNLQNIPIRDEQGREVRKAFIADENSVFVSADYSQVELRIMAHLSNDKAMIAAFRSGQDIHAATAANIYKIPLEAVTKDMRRKAKTANFGIIYGISAFGLSERLQIPRIEAKELIDSYFVTFPQVKEYMEKCITEAREKGYVETIFGRKRYLPDINSRNINVRGFAERNAINAPIQGSAADIIKVAMVRIHNRMEELNLKSQMILQVHDELNFIVENSELETMKQIIQKEMENVIPLQIPLKVDIGIGKNWLEAH